MDNPVSNAIVQGSQSISGWARDFTGKYSVTSIKIYIDGVHIDNATYGRYRSDLKSNVGWDYTWNTENWAGKTVTVKARFYSGDKSFDIDKQVKVIHSVGQGSPRKSLFEAAYNRHSGAAKMGQPIEATLWAFTNRIRLQGFRGGSYGDCHIFDDEDDNLGAFVLHGAIRARYLQMGKTDSALRAPRGDEKVAPTSFAGTTGFAQRFERGQMISSNRGTFWVVNQIDAKYTALSGSGDIMGFLTGDQSEVKSGASAIQGWFNDFEGGRIFHANQLGTYEVHGAVFIKYQAAGGATGALGLPTSDETSATSSKGTTGRTNTFEGGSVFYIFNSGRSYVVEAPIAAKYKQAGSYAGSYGFPTSDAYAYQGGTRQDFEGGSLTVGANASALDLRAATELRATVQGSKVTLNWKDNSAGETGYIVERKTGANGGWARLLVGNVPDLSSFVDNQSPGTYIYRVSAYKYGVAIGPTGAEVSATVSSSSSLDLRAATELRATVQGSKVTLNWKDNSTGETGYIVERKTGVNGGWARLIVGNVPDLNSFVDNQSPGTYIYRVSAYKYGVAIGPTGAEVSVTVSSSSSLDLRAATELKATVQGTTVALSWKDNSTGETGYIVERKTGANGGWARLIVGNVPDLNSFTDNQSPGTYIYRVSAYKYGVAIGPTGAEVSVTVSSSSSLDLRAATDLRATVQGAKVTLDWKDNSTGETGYIVERKTGANGGWARLLVGNVPDLNSFVDNQSPGTYFYRVSAYKYGVAIGPTGAEVSATVAPPASTQLTVLSQTLRVRLEWSDDHAPRSGFEIERALFGSDAWVQLLRGTDPNQTSFVDETVPLITRYVYRVRAYRSGVNNYPYSNSASGQAFVPLNRSSPTSPSAGGS